MRPLLPLALVAAVLVAGCGGGNSNETAGGPSDTTPAKPSVDDRTQALRDYVRGNFSTASWYDDITGIRIEGQTAYIDTSYFNDSDVAESARAICAGTASAGLPADQPKVAIEVVAVLDSSGRPITNCGPQTPPV